MHFIVAYLLIILMLHAAQLPYLGQCEDGQQSAKPFADDGFSVAQQHIDDLNELLRNELFTANKWVLLKKVIFQFCGITSSFPLPAHTDSSAGKYTNATMHGITKFCAEIRDEMPDAIFIQNAQMAVAEFGIGTTNRQNLANALVSIRHNIKIVTKEYWNNEETIIIIINKMKHADDLHAFLAHLSDKMAKDTTAQNAIGTMMEIIDSKHQLKISDIDTLIAGPILTLLFNEISQMETKCGRKKLAENSDGTTNSCTNILPTNSNWQNFGAARRRQKRNDDVRKAFIIAIVIVSAMIVTAIAFSVPHILSYVIAILLMWFLLWVVLLMADQ